MTPAKLKRKAEILFRKENPAATIAWTMTPRLVTYPTGLRQLTGQFHATAPGYRSRNMTVAGDDSFTMIR